MAQAVNEILEDRLTEAVKHCQDFTTVEGKPCEITITVKVTPSKDRKQFALEVAGRTKFSPRESAESSLFTGFDEQGRVIFIQYDPQNQLPFGG